MLEPLDKNCYEFFLEGIAEYRQQLDYDAVEQFGHKIKISVFLEHVERLAAYMKEELHLGAGDVYTVFLPTSIQSFVAFYALNKLGVVINFVHPLSPPEVLLEAMRDTRSQGILILDLLAAKYVNVINEYGTPCLVCSYSDYAGGTKKIGLRAFEPIGSLPALRIHERDSYRSAISKKRSCEGVSGNGKDLAVYLHGGGTTGKSKTIKLSSFAINSVTAKVCTFSEIEEPGIDATIMVLPLFHAFGLAIAMHVPMCRAGRIIPMSQFNSKRFNALMRKNKIIFIVGIPVMYKKMMHEDNFDGEHLKNLRLLFCGGDDVTELALDEFNQYLEKWGARGRLYRGYGLTEVASVCSTNRDGAVRRNSIGTPLDGIEMQIWDENKTRLPNGEIGEIVISGSTIMEGYFTPGGEESSGLFTDDSGKKWVLSGDLGYQDDDNYFYFSGRKKRIIIISGYNVYPNDIEACVEQLPFIREVCAAQGYQNGKPIVRLFVSFRRSGDEEEYKKEILKQCEEHLSTFSIPRDIVVMSELPRTHMKKVDFMKLTEMLPK